MLDTTEKIDLAWVTFAEKDPEEPCIWTNCPKTASWDMIPEPCGHSHYLCTAHKHKNIIDVAAGAILYCSICKEIPVSFKVEPLKRG